MVTDVCQPEILPNLTAGSSHPKKPGRLTLQQGWNLVICRPLGQQTMDLVGNRCWHSWDCRSLCRRPHSSKCFDAIAILTSSLSSVCSLLYRLQRRHMSKCYPTSGIKLLARKLARLAIVERFNNTLRQQVGRLVRKTLSFSKKLSNHIGAIWYFVHHYNASL